MVLPEPPSPKSHQGKQEMQSENQARVKNNPFCTRQSSSELFGHAKRKNRPALKATSNSGSYKKNLHPPLRRSQART